MNNTENFKLIQAVGNYFTSQSAGRENGTSQKERKITKKRKNKKYTNSQKPM